MYFVNREKIDSTLIYIETCLEVFQGQSSWSSPIEKLALERIGHSLIESMIDVGNAMIDGFIMRDQGSYEDIIDILEDEKVLSKEDSKGIRNVIRYRKPLVQSYLTIDHDELFLVLSKNIKELKKFSDSVRNYLEKELGPVSAFLPKD